jgi:hypothetical protein
MRNPLTYTELDLFTLIIIIIQEDKENDSEGRNEPKTYGS